MASSAASNNALCGSLLGLSTIAVSLRFWARRAQQVRLAADDWCMLLAQATFVGMVICVLLGVRFQLIGYDPYANGKMELIGPPQRGAQLNYAMDSLGSASLGATKLSVLFFYERVFCIKGRRDTYRIVLWILMALTVLWAITYVILPPLQCGSHLSAAWTPDLGPQYCSITAAYILSQKITDVIFDIIVLLIPIPKIIALKASIRKRAAILLVFLTAGVALGASVGRLAVQYYRGYDPSVGDRNLQEAYLLNTKCSFLWILEAGFAIIAANLPTLIWLQSSKAPAKMLAVVRRKIPVASFGRSWPRDHSKDKPADQSRYANMAYLPYGVRVENLLTQEVEVV